MKFIRNFKKKKRIVYRARLFVSQLFSLCYLHALHPRFDVDN